MAHPPRGSRDWKLPEQPKILAKIEDAARQPRLHFHTLATLVIQDVSLCALLLKAVNSSYFGLENRIGSIEQAIALLGLEQTLNIARTEALRRVGGGGAHGQADSRITVRSHEIATLCAIIAAECFSPKEVPSEHAYMIGQFHDCGIAMLMRDYPDYCATLDSPEPTLWPDLLAEDQRNQTDHAMVGSLLAEDWKLPAAVCQAIRYHHHIANTEEEDEARFLVAILQMAMHLYNQLTKNDDCEWRDNAKAVLEVLGLETDEVEEFEEEIHTAFRARKVHAT
jgi:HD-like signal output (HDOD) protein